MEVTEPQPALLLGELGGDMAINGSHVDRLGMEIGNIGMHFSWSVLALSKATKADECIEIHKCDNGGEVMLERFVSMPDPWVRWGGLLPITLASRG